MVNTYGGTRGGYAAVTGPITQVIQDQVIVEINKLKALFTSTARNANTADTQFGRMAPVTKSLIVAEIDALIAAFDATPTS